VQHSTLISTRSPTRHEERLFKNIKLDAPTFDACLDPRVFTQWTRDMDRFFNIGMGFLRIGEFNSPA
jgi:hypothetical protein